MEGGGGDETGEQSYELVLFHEAPMKHMGLCCCARHMGDWEGYCATHGSAPPWGIYLPGRNRIVTATRSC